MFLWSSNIIPRQRQGNYRQKFSCVVLNAVPPILSAREWGTISQGGGGGAGLFNLSSIQRHTAMQTTDNHIEAIELDVGMLTYFSSEKF